MSTGEQQPRASPPGGRKVRRQLEKVRKELLGTSKRVRLIQTPRHTKWAKTIEIVDELSDQVYSILVEKGRKMSFLVHPDLEEDQDEVSRTQLALLPQPDSGDHGTELASRHTDSKLQTKLSSRKLQSRLLGLYRDSKTLLEEQGISTLCLAVGFLRWYEAAQSDSPLHAPLILLPVEIERKGANQVFKINYSGEDLWPNLPLDHRLRSDHQIDLPDLGDSERFRPSDYFKAVQQTIQGLPKWSVLANDMVLGIFSFQKLLMYRDLDPANWPSERRIEDHRLIRMFLDEGSERRGDEGAESLDKPVDSIPHRHRLHILPADSSQAQAIEAAKGGLDLVIQGPPGTGKSQTITNLIAAGVREGKRVLFLSQKKAALEVVHQKLANLNLGAMCLELHSHKARKKEVLEELERTLSLQTQSSASQWAQTSERLDRLCEERNRLLEELHTPIGATNLTPYVVAGELVALRLEGFRAASWSLPSKVDYWSDADFTRHCAVIENFQQRACALDTPHEHSWRGVGLTTLLPSDFDRIRSSVGALKISLDGLLPSVAKLKGQVRGLETETYGDLVVAQDLASRVANAPDLDFSAYSSEVWRTQRHELETAVQAGRRYSAAFAEAEDIFIPDAWDEEWGRELTLLRSWRGSLFRWFNKEYRAATRKIRGFLRQRPRGYLLDSLSSLVDGQRALEELEVIDEQAARAFGARWMGHRSDWNHLSRILDWDDQLTEAVPLPAIRALAVSLSSHPALARFAEDLAAQTQELEARAEALFAHLDFDLQAGFDSNELPAVDLRELHQRVGAWSSDSHLLEPWCAFRLAYIQVAELGLKEFADQVACGDIEPPRVLSTFRYSILESWLGSAFTERPRLAATDISQLSRTIADFSRLDLQHQRLAVRRVAAAHVAKLPNGTTNIGEVGLIRAEAGKKRNLLPLRRLFARAGRAIQAIKPVFMMSPLSVAQFLKPGQLEFDLLLIDEASQLPPEDSLGAMARSRQIVVVGDDQQLPPTRFFDRLNAAEDDDEFEDNAADLESILRLANRAGLPSKMLRWHYRSRHESLIAVSNKEFYDNRLYIPPSALSQDVDLGLFFRPVGGVYERGRTSANPREAREVARAVLDHAAENPGLSLGVATFSVKQRDAILDELEFLRRESKKTEPFFSSKNTEPFFVKNLEAVQGDERDVVFISVGYGRDESGYMAMNFGPIAVSGGERRLNVLISRARSRCVVFSSIAAGDIDLQRARSRGAHVLKTYLQYAATGELDISGPDTGEVESPFEAAVAQRLQGLGYTVDAQVRFAGFRIDLAIRDPNRPGRYLLAVECDGASYHSSRSARDRDILREQVLRDRGWSVLRVWSTDWLNDPDAQLGRLVEAIEMAKNSAIQPSLLVGSTNTRPPNAYSRQPPQPRATRPPKSLPYEIASLRLKRGSPHELRPRDLLNRAIRPILEVEKIVHVEELARRVASVWGLQRAGQRVLAATKAAVRLGLGRTLAIKGDFVQLAGLTKCQPRDRSKVDSTTLRQPRYLPPLEIATALIDLVAQHRGVARDELVLAGSRIFGFQRTGPQLRDAMVATIDELVREGRLVERGGRLDVNSRAS